MGFELRVLARFGVGLAMPPDLDLDPEPRPSELVLDLEVQGHWPTDHILIRMSVRPPTCWERLDADD